MIDFPKFEVAEPLSSVCVVYTAATPEEAAVLFCRGRTYTAFERKRVEVRQFPAGEWATYDVDPVFVPSWKASRVDDSESGAS